MPSPEYPHPAASLSLHALQAMAPWLDQFPLGLAWEDPQGKPLGHNQIYQALRDRANTDANGSDRPRDHRVSHPITDPTWSDPGRLLIVMPQEHSATQNPETAPWTNQAPPGQTRIVLNQVLETIPHFVFWKDRQCRYLGCNQNFAVAAGRDKPEDLIGLNDYDLVWKKEESDFFIACDQKVMQSGEAMINIEEPQAQADGIEKWLLTSKVPLRDDHGRVIGILGMFADITDRKQAEAERERLNRQLVEASREAGKAEIATGVLHNVGNALNSIATSANVAQERSEYNASRLLSAVAKTLEPHKNRFKEYAQSDPKAAHLPALLSELAGKINSDFATISSELKSLKHQLDHVEAIVRAQQNYSTTRTVHLSVDPRQLISDALRVSSATANDSLTDVVINTTPATGSITTDTHAVLQILVNLITNAKQAMRLAPPNGQHQLTLSAEPGDEPGTINFKVQDTGIGIEPDHLTQIFQHGFTTKDDGHGFGLHTAANTAQSLGGNLQATSPGPNLGATFTLTLPMACADAQAA